MFGDYLRAEIDSHGLSQAEAARRARLSPAGINQYCQGLKRPAYGPLLKLLRAFPRLLSAVVEEAFDIDQA